MSTRRWDGEPETEADARFFDERESGYAGPLDDNSYRVTTGEDAAILKRMADQRGEDTSWWTGDLPDQGRSRTSVLLLVAPWVVVVVAVIIGISHLRGW